MDVSPYLRRILAVVGLMLVHSLCTRYLCARCVLISHVHERQYKTALEHMTVRAGTAIPTGAAEGALAFIYEKKEEAWPFLAERLVVVDAGDTREISPRNGPTSTNDREERAGSIDTEGEAAVSEKSAVPSGPRKTDGKSRPDEGGIGRQEKRNGRDLKYKKSSPSGDVVLASFSLAQVSAALEAFARACKDRGCAPEGLAVPELVNFFYLGGQAKVRFRYLRRNTG